MKLSRDWLGDYVDLDGLTDEELGRRLTEIGHAVEAVGKHEGDTVFDLEITTNRADAMSHRGMARELAAAFGRNLTGSPKPVPPAVGVPAVTIEIAAPEMCARYSGRVIAGVTVKPSPPQIQRRLEAVGLRPINNVVDATNYVMLALGHPLHAFDLAKVGGPKIVVRRGLPGEKVRTLDGEIRAVDPETVIIADAARGVALGGIMGGEESEISPSTRDVLLECAWFDPSVIRRTARRLGMKTDASYRFERRADPADTVDSIELATELILAWGGGTPGEVIDVHPRSETRESVVLRADRLRQASAGAVGPGYALELLRRLGFDARADEHGVHAAVPSWRGDVHEEIDLVEEVLRFFGLNNVPAELPRLTTGDSHHNPYSSAEDVVREVLTGCGLSEAITYSFVSAKANALFSDEQPVALSNSLSENIAAMRLSMIPGLLETVAFNRSYGNRDGGVFEVGRTYHRSEVAGPAEVSTAAGHGPLATQATGPVRETRRFAIALFGNTGAFWGDAKRPFDFFDAKGVVEAVAGKFHVVPLFAEGSQPWLRAGRRASIEAGGRIIGSAGFLTPEVLLGFGIKGEVVVAEIDLGGLLAAQTEWKMAPVARYPGVPMILAVTHRRDLDYRRLVDAIRSMNVPHLHDTGLRDRFAAEADPDTVKTTLGMWYQAHDRSLTQEEVAEAHASLASRLAAMLPVTVLKA